MVRELQHKFIRTTMLVVTILLVVFLAVINVANYIFSDRDTRSSLDRVFSRYAVQFSGVPEGAAGPAGLTLPEDAAGQEGLTLPENAAVPAGGIEPDGGAVREDGKPEAQQRPERPGMTEGDPGIYFAALVNENGAVMFSDLSHAGDLAWDEMIALLQEADDSFGVEVTGESETEAAEFEAEAGAGGLPEETRQLKTIRSLTGRTGGYAYWARQLEDHSVAYAFLNISREIRSRLRILLVTIAAGIGTWFLVLLVVIRLSQRAIAPIAENIERQRRFITDAGHELKTPLAVIISNVDVQELHGGKTKWLDNIRAQALRLSDLTKQMLTLAKMDESGSGSFTATSFDASQLTEDVVRVFRESASLRGIRVTARIGPDVQITFSKEQYQQMLELLLDNAVKYANENGEINASLSADRKTVSLNFSNTCEELPDIDPDRLFDRFYRADTSRSRQTGGSG
ncbi:MAG: HAMP domain-containing histidine kinase, partial [Lachnospiraceae bacterium]|nr:HAMP domain-containing histidine kinase [Lachnospiraceae bacterium]